MFITSTPDLLIIESRPWFLGGLLIATMVGFLGMAIWLFFSGDIAPAAITLAGVPVVFMSFWAFVRRNQLVLNAVDGSVTHSRRSVMGYTRLTYRLVDLDRATVASSTTREGRDIHRMELHITGGMDAGVHPFVAAYISGSGPQRAADALNEWIAQHRTSGRRYG